MISFSIILPAYNCEKTIIKSINSILNQTYSNFEIIVVNDGSTDSTLNLLESIKDKRLHLINQKNSGPAKARVEGIKNAINDYILFLDSDDEYELNALEILDQKLTKNNVDVVYYQHTIYENETKFNKVKYNEINYLSKNKKDLLKTYFYNNSFPSLWGLCIKRSSLNISSRNINKIYGMRKSEDYALIMIMFSRFDSGLFIDDHLYKYYSTINPNSLSSQKTKKNSFFILKLTISMMKTYFSKKELKNFYKIKNSKLKKIIVDLFYHFVRAEL